MSLETDVQVLTQATTDLLSAVNVKKATLDQSVDDAAAQVALATTQATNAAASAATATTKAGEAAGSAASALAIYGNTAAQQAAVTAAQNAASVAAGHAASASSVVQQDLSGVNAAALHRSPNAVTAMFVYDTSKDSDGGAWTEKCQHTSWYNEAINGKWLGAQPSETNARNEGATLGSELVPNGTFDTGITGWRDTTSYAGSTVTWDAGTLKLTVGPSVSYCDTALTPSLTVVIGKVYRVSITITSSVNGLGIVQIGNQSSSVAYLNSGSLPQGTYTYYITATNTELRLALLGYLANAQVKFDNISVREVTAQTTQSGDYFQLTTDGKFYRLWKNLLQQTASFDNSYWSKLSATVMANAATAPDGSLTADTLVEDTTNNLHIAYRSFALTQGTPHTFSLRVQRASGTRDVALRLDDGGISRRSVVNLTSGATTPATGHTVTATQSGGWWTIAVTFTPTTSAPAVIGVELRNGTDSVYTGDGVSSLNIWGAQLEYGTTATNYEAKGAEGSISEVFRGNKREFPKLSAIVAESGNVTIYDLAEPGRPMWMRFVAGGNITATYNMISGSTSTVAGLSAVNGLLCAASSNSGSEFGGLATVNFVSEAAKAYRTAAATGQRNYAGLISQRNAARGHDTTTNAAAAMPSAVINAVAMTVLPDAPVDPVTGLQVPTIAVGTASGPSVIRHDGTVTNPYGASLATFNVDFGSRGELIFHVGENNQNYRVSYQPYTTYITYNNSPARPLNNGPVNKVNTKRIAAIRGTTTNEIFFFRDNNSGSRSSAARVANTFNTGHMTGDIRRAYLADVDAGSVTGPELWAQLSTFQSQAEAVAAGYSFTNCTFDQATKSVVFSGGSASLGFPGSGLVAGNSYKLAFEGAKTSGVIVFQQNFITLNTYSSLPSTSLMLRGSGELRLSTVDFVGSISGVSARQVVADRSYKASGAIINGTLTKTQVASAAQLVSYSGFSASNYLREPYSADLDFAQGEWSASAWVNVPTTLPVSSFPVVGSELVLNGDFGSEAIGWTLGSNVTISGGAALFSGVASGVGITRASPSNFIVGAHYLVEFDVISYTSGSGIYIRLGGGGAFTPSSPPSVGHKKLIVQATGPGTLMEFKEGGSNGTYSIDNISVREIGSALIADRAHSSGSRIQLGADAGGKITATAFDGNTTRTVTTSAAYNTATWLKVRANYTTDGSLALLVNGQEVAVTRGAPLLTLNNSNAVLTIGNSYAADAPFPGSLALVKFSATVPTAEQSVWMYEQEKQMFREGAQVCLPDSGSIVDLTYDDATDKWIAVSATNESEWSGLVRTSVTAVPAGSYTKAAAASGVQLLARSTTNPGVDITIPSYGLRKELVKRAEATAKQARTLVPFDYVGGFTASTTNGSTSITSVAGLSYPTSYIGARVSGSGIPTDTVITAVSGTTIYLSKAATATATGVQISFTDFILPVGYEAKDVLLAGVSQKEGATSQFVRQFDGFKETIRFGTAPAYNANVSIQAARSIQ